MEIKRGNFYLEQWEDILKVYWNLDKLIYTGKTDFQKVVIGNNAYIGVFLALDGKIQSSEFDEYIYHEALVHPAMLNAYPVKNVLIIGNGEGCATREVLKYNSVESLDWVDLDEKVVSICRNKLPYSWKGNDPRTNLVFMDGYKFLKETARTNKKYDVILMDLTEYNQNVPLSNKLFGYEALKLIKSILTKNGSLVTQCTNILKNGDVEIKNVPTLIDRAFKYKRTMHIFVPSFLSEYRLVLATDKSDPINLPKSKIQKIIEPFVNSLRYYDGEYHRSLMTLPREARVYGRKTF